MHSVAILARFTTGTTVDDYDKARERTKALLLKMFKEAGIAGEKSTDGLFEMEIVDVNSESIPLKPLGSVERTPRGFEIIEFIDAQDCKCSLQQSSAIGNTKTGVEQPGSSAVWLGVNQEDPKISGRMHLGRVQVERLIAHLQAWLKTGELDL